MLTDQIFKSVEECDLEVQVTWQLPANHSAVSALSVVSVTGGKAEGKNNVSLYQFLNFPLVNTSPSQLIYYGWLQTENKSR